MLKQTILGAWRGCGDSFMLPRPVPQHLGKVTRESASQHPLPQTLRLSEPESVVRSYLLSIVIVTYSPSPSSSPPPSSSAATAPAWEIRFVLGAGWCRRVQVSFRSLTPTEIKTKRQCSLLPHLTSRAKGWQLLQRLVCSDHRGSVATAAIFKGLSLRNWKLCQLWPPTLGFTSNIKTEPMKKCERAPMSLKQNGHG